MNVCVVTALTKPGSKQFGGIGSWARKLIDSSILKAAGVNITIVDTSMSLQRCESQRKSVPDELRRTIRIFKALCATFKTKQDIYHINSNCSNLGLIRDWLCSVMVLLRKKKYVTMFHCDISSYSFNLVSYFCLKMFVKHASANFVLNKHSEDYIESHFFEKSIFMPLFVSNDELKYIDSLHEVPRANDKIIYVGRISKAKGSDFLIDLAKELSQYKFVLIGSISDNLDKGIPENVILKGVLGKEDVLSELKSSSLFVFPSRSEGFPNVILEAMISKLPVISSDCGATSLMLDSKGGIIIKEYELEKWVMAIRAIMGDSLRRSEMGELNYNKCISCFSETSVMKYMAEKYKGAFTH